MNENKIKDKKPFYICNPEKHPECLKTVCHINGGSCKLTVYRDYAKTDENGQPIEATDNELPF